MTEAIELERYSDWFIWARENLARDLDGTHAAAEAAYWAAVRGGSDAEVHVTAEAASGEPTAIDPETMALAEWVAWARSTGRFSDEQALVVARFALGAVQSSHDLDATIADVLSVAPPQQREVGQKKTTPNYGAAKVVGVVAALVILGGATAGVISGLGGKGGGSAPDQKPPAANASVSAILQPSGSAAVDGVGFPPNTIVYVFVDQEMVQRAETDGAGSVLTTVPMPLGAHNISICLDQQEARCPASTFISRDQ